MNRRLAIRLGNGLVALALVGAAWFLFAPAQIGGHTSYAVIKGNSMEPGLHGGDLAVVRSRGSYDIGDAVLFESETLEGAHVLHRIVEARGGRFVTRGDNRTGLDPDRFTADAIVGELWVSIPSMGSALTWIGRPLPLAVLAFVAAFLVLAGGREASRRRRYPPVPAVHAVPVEGSSAASRVPAVASSLLGAGLVAAVLFGAFALLAWTRPETSLEEVAGGYVQSGTFGYDAKVSRSAVYPDGEVVTGQAIFTELVDRVRFSFDYHFTSRERSALRGSVGLDAVLSDGNGWSRALHVALPRSFEGPDGHVEGVLDLRRVTTAVASMRDLTKATEPGLVVAITPRVQIAGYAGATVIDTTYEPELPLAYDFLSLRLDQPEGEGDPLTPREEGVTTAVESTRVGFGALSLTTADARSFAAVGLGASLLLAIASALILGTRLRGAPGDALRQRYGARIVDAQVVIPEGRWVSDVREPESLGLIAEHYDRVILHTVESGADVYVVDDGVAIYRYRVTEARVPSARVSPAPGG